MDHVRASSRRASSLGSRIEPEPQSHADPRRGRARRSADGAVDAAADRDGGCARPSESARKAGAEMRIGERIGGKRSQTPRRGPRAGQPRGRAEPRRVASTIAVAVPRGPGGGPIRRPCGVSESSRSLGTNGNGGQRGRGLAGPPPEISTPCRRCVSGYVKQLICRWVAAPLLRSRATPRSGTNVLPLCRPLVLH